MEEAFKALADPHRRLLLDRLFQNDGQSLGALCRELTMSRQAVSKHLLILEQAGLVTVHRQGREKHHYLNPVPIQRIYDRWISRFTAPWVSGMVTLGRILEAEEPAEMVKPKHIYEIYIGTTPEKLWQALTTPEYTRRYFHQTLIASDWREGAEVLFTMENGEKAVSGTILEVDPPRRLSYTWRVHYDAELEGEAPSRVSFEIEALEGACKLTLIHDDFPEDSAVYPHVSKGWSAIICNLKTLLETGQPIPIS